MPWALEWVWAPSPRFVLSEDFRAKSKQCKGRVFECVWVSASPLALMLC